MTRVARLKVAALVPLFLAGPAVTASPPDPTERLWRAENVRIGEMLRLEATGGTPPSPPRAAGAARTAPAAAEGRRVEVSTSDALVLALADARPGDVIHLADGVYPGTFVASVSGTRSAPITLVGSRAAVLDGGSTRTGYGFHLRAHYWVLEGFCVRNARKGIMTDGASHNTLRRLEVHRIGDEGIHFRAFSSDNVLEQSWIHDVGLVTPLFGEGVYLGSASSNWASYSGGYPDASDRNRVIGNLIGPNITAEGLDVKEGTTGGEIIGNVFLGAGMTSADSWVDLKGNGYRARDNRGNHDSRRRFVPGGFEVRSILAGWGLGNRVEDNLARPRASRDRGAPFRAAHGDRGPVTIVLPGRALPYSLTELVARFPDSFERVGPDTVLAREHVLGAPGAALTIASREVRELRLMSMPGSFASLVSADGAIEIAGTAEARVAVRSWDPAADRADSVPDDGRAYVAAKRGRMDLERVDATDLGFGTGWTSGVAWQGSSGRKSSGRVTEARFERNHFGAYTFEAEAMHWSNNVFANNLGYGFDPHDFSSHFVVTGNAAFGNGYHGIIFSRGCRANVLRNNRCYDNRGHGIMLDDGKVADDGDPRHVRAVPSDDNVIEDNQTWNNDVGIALEGGTGNAVRANDVHDNDYGIRLQDRAYANEVARKTIRGSRMFAIYIYDHSDRNRIVDNQIEGGRGAIIVKESVGNLIKGNVIRGIVGRGIGLEGVVTDSKIDHNLVAGRGSRAIDPVPGPAPASEAPASEAPADNRTWRWMQTGGFLPAGLIWVTVLCVPLIMSIRGRWKGPSR